VILAILGPEQIALKFNGKNQAALEQGTISIDVDQNDEPR
jgi:hypothetical protein